MDFKSIRQKQFHDLDMRSSWFHKLSSIFGTRLPGSWLVLCLISLIALILVLGSSSSNSVESVRHSPASLIYSNYRRIKEQTAVDYLELGSVSLDTTQQGEIDFCGKERENFVPCYNVSANMLAGFGGGEEFDRHCEFSRGESCVVRIPKDYNIPLRWPAGKDVIWSGNVKISKNQFLSSGSMTKR